MNLELTEEQVLLREAARGALSRFRTFEAARDGLEGGERLDLWPAAREAGWPGLLVGEERGGAGLSVFDATLVLMETGRVLAGVELLGHLPASALLDKAGHEATAEVAEGTRRAAFVPARPPDDLGDAWTVEARQGSVRAGAPRLGDDGTVSGEVPWVPDAAGADLLVVAAVRSDGTPAAVAVRGSGDGVTVEAIRRYDATRNLGHVRFDGARGDVLEGLGGDDLAGAWYLAHTLLAAESIGAVETCLDVSVQYAKDRFTFGRPIGSYQAVKHGLVEILRRRENAYSLLLYAGWAFQDARDELPVAASAARASAGHALDYGAREMIAVHGGIGATWEHDAPLFFRRSQLSRRLLGGLGDASDRVAGELLTQAIA